MSARHWDIPKEGLASSGDVSQGEWVAIEDIRDLESPQALLEREAIFWRRDFDAIGLGFVLGVLSTLAVQGVW